MKTTLDWLNLAVSKDETRFNINSVYRDKTCLVATDGHRLHMQTNLPESSPQFLDGKDAVFPTYIQVMPKQPSTHELVITLRFSDKDVKAHIQSLDKLCALIKPFDKARCARITLDGDKATLSGDYKHFSFSIDLRSLERIYPPSVPNKPITVGINLSYFIDVLKYGLVQSTCFKMQFHGDLGPILFTDNNINIQAIVMPMRIVENATSHYKPFTASAAANT